MATKKAASKGTKKAASKKAASARKSAKKAASKKTSAGKCEGWVAVQDNMPPGPPRLYVTGKCTFPTSGYKVTLKEAAPQGKNPAILLLNKIVTPPTGIVRPVETTVDVRFDKKKATTRYKSVTILPDGGTVKVQQVF
ncbi:MAG TPA: hypothetical protein VJT09_13275 [Pyrinomonadaceae bacterium]|nr:hypothetical protein [Pyrinomonadaceae bacterium]